MMPSFAAPIIIFNLALTGILVYCLILFIKLAHRGIKALDIYIEKNNKSDKNL